VWDELELLPPVHLGAQVAHGDVDDVAAGVELVPPDVLGQDLARQHLAGVAHEVLEQRELTVGQLDVLAAAPDPQVGAVEHHVGEAQRQHVGGGAAAEQRPHARENSSNAKGLVR